MQQSLFNKIFSNYMMFAFLFLISFTCVTTTQASINSIAVVKNPIIEMSGVFPIPLNQSICGNSNGCHRSHQGLYNELVSIIEEKDGCFKIACNNVVYGYDSESKEKLNSFWVHKKDLVELKKLTDETLQVIPCPKYGQEPTIVLTYPWKTFSAGTRFNHIPEQDTLTAYAIKRVDFTANAILIDFIAHKNALVETKKHMKAARKLFVKNINHLIDRVSSTNKKGMNNVIPYVWGGSSFTIPYQDSNFYLADGSWQRTGKNDPYSGYDCSEFVMRMAQIAGIEFPWKTTKVMEESKRALAKNEPLENGDLIWISGHVMIVSNIKRNEIIEARGYKSGYGRIHRLTLTEIFDGIKTYDDLLKKYHLGQAIQLKDKQGITVEKEYPFKLLKLLD
ncbi:MAG: NlpC/P60 family protein [Candidatus Dependentiae bacterium]|nr:NlpC/P60 family protein [Candidatus Dependentiae bacterium]